MSSNVCTRVGLSVSDNYNANVILSVGDFVIKLNELELIDPIADLVDARWIAADEGWNFNDH